MKKENHLLILLWQLFKTGYDVDNHSREQIMIRGLREHDVVDHVRHAVDMTLLVMYINQDSESCFP